MADQGQGGQGDQGPDRPGPIPTWAPPEAPPGPYGTGPAQPPGPAWGPPAWQQPGTPPPAAPGGRSWWPWILGAVGVLVAVAIVAVLLSSDDDDDSGGRAVASGGGAGEGDLFEDPQGEYTIELHPDWEQGDDVITGIESFLIAEQRDGFAPNVNVVSAADAPAGIDEDTYVSQASRLIGQSIQGGEVLDSGVTQGSDGSDRGFIEYRGQFGPGAELHFLAIIDVADGTSVTVTLTAPEDRFAELRDEAEDYMLTVRAS